MPKTNSLDFSSPAGAEKAIKQITQQLGRAGQTVVSSEFSNKARRSSDTTYREAFLTLVSGQMITLRVNSTGDIYQVVLNKSVMPLKEHTDIEKAVGEIASMAEKNQHAFQKAQARKAVALPRGMSTPKHKQVDALTQQVAELDTQITERKATIAALVSKLGGAMTDSVPELTGLDDAARDVLTKLAKAEGQVLEDGDVPSKSGRDTLIDLGLIDRYTEKGANVLNDKGRACAALLDSAPPVSQSSTSDGLPVLTLASTYVAAREIVAASGIMLDDAATAGAVAHLQAGLEVVENNGPINLAEGNVEQALHEMRMAESFRTAIAMLDSAKERQMDDKALDQLVAIAKVSAASEDEIADQDALATLLALAMVDVAEGIYFLTEKGRQHLNENGMDAYGEPFAE
ncbi:hypothetical protein [Pseudomonas sp. TWP3-2]|uniref:defense against restriction DarA-related protein n=1 Tax=Pseudomonas sp. TWP3-2 TaxID=2804574 RepID=UPI003CE7C76F